jgi:hypothetical protein
MGNRRTRAYWPTRIMLAAAIIARPAALYWLVAMQPATMGGHSSSPGLEWVGVSTLAAGAALWLAGVIWMIRIMRGPRDDPPPWRSLVR